MIFHVQTSKVQNDPYEVRILYTGQSKNTTDPHLFDRDLSALIPRLDALLMVPKSCKANTCIKPWDVLHPDGSEQSLTDAMDEMYDRFYGEQPKVSYSKCEEGYIIGYEGPQEVVSWEAWT